jgi:hypothetical protein
MTQKRLPKFRRIPEAVATRQITDTSLAIIDTIERYHLIPTSILVRLVEGNDRVTARHLQRLYHKGLINRFCFMKGRIPGEFHYYLDNPKALDHLVEADVDPTQLDFEGVRRNRDKRYCDINDSIKAEELEGTRLFLKHEAMISRFHGMLELACSISAGKVELVDWRQGPGLWNKIEVPKVIYRDGKWLVEETTELLPHRPDAFFTLSFQNSKGEKQQYSFFYEADRKTTNTTRLIRKLRAHFHYVVVQNKHREHFEVPRIRAVLVETLDTHWADYLRQQAATHPAVSNKPSMLFWFTALEMLTKPVEVEQGQSGKRKKSIPYFLLYPEAIFSKRWRSPVDDTLYSLLD